MFVPAKKSGNYPYLQLVHNERVDGRIRLQVIATLGRLDRLQPRSGCTRCRRTRAAWRSLAQRGRGAIRFRDGRVPR